MARGMSVTSDDPPIGPPVPGWSTRQLPPLVAMSGRFCRVEPIDSTRHGAALCAAYATDREGRLWTYLPWGPYSGPEELCARIDAVRASGVRPEYALIDLSSGKPFGQASYLNIDPAAGSIEVGGIVFAPEFQRGIAATPRGISPSCIEKPAGAAGCAPRCFGNRGPSCRGTKSSSPSVAQQVAWKGSCSISRCFTANSG